MHTNLWIYKNQNKSIYRLNVTYIDSANKNDGLFNGCDSLTKHIIYVGVLIVFIDELRIVDYFGTLLIAFAGMMSVSDMKRLLSFKLGHLINIMTFKFGLNGFRFDFFFFKILLIRMRAIYQLIQTALSRILQRINPIPLHTVNQIMRTKLYLAMFLDLIKNNRDPNKDGKNVN